jgi:hypothetical protein
MPVPSLINLVGNRQGSISTLEHSFTTFELSYFIFAVKFNYETFLCMQLIKKRAVLFGFGTFPAHVFKNPFASFERVLSNA